MIEREDPARLATLDDHAAADRTGALLHGADRSFWIFLLGIESFCGCVRSLVAENPGPLGQTRNRRRERQPSCIWIRLVTDRDHAEVARRASLVTVAGLSGARTRHAASSSRLSALGSPSVCQSDATSQDYHRPQGRIEERDRRAAGALAWPPVWPPLRRTTGSRFDEFTRGQDEATREAAVFLCPDWGVVVPGHVTRTPATLRLLIQRFGPMFAPDEEWKEGIGGSPGEGGRENARVHSDPRRANQKFRRRERRSPRCSRIRPWPTGG